MDAVVIEVENPNWSRDHGMNRMFLRALQANLNDRLQNKGFLTVNEVCADLSFEQTEEGALSGWVKDGVVELFEMHNGDGSFSISLNPNSTNVFRDRRENEVKG